MVANINQIRQLLKDNFEISNNRSPAKWTIVKDDIVDVEGHCVTKKSFARLPVTFNNVSGSFLCYSAQLTTLEGCPRYVGGSFECGHNELTSLVGGPDIVRGHYVCVSNPLTSLEGAPKTVGEDFFLTWTPDLPVLRLLKYNHISFDHGRKIVDILKKYNGPNLTRSKILACQKELIENGFEGNARW